MLNRYNLIASGVAASVTLAIGTSAVADPLPTAAVGPQCDVVFAVNDAGLNNSQIVTVGGDGSNVQSLSKLYPGCDLEAMDIDNSNVLYVASGDDVIGCLIPDSGSGHLYKVNKLTGEVMTVGPLCAVEVDGISINPADDTLWGWGQDQGLFRVLRGTDGELDLSTCKIYLPAVPNDEIEDITWDNTGNTLYGIGNVYNGNHDATVDDKKPRAVVAFTPATGDIRQVCRDVLAIYPEIEGIEAQPDGTLMFSYHNADKLSAYGYINPADCALNTGKDVANPTQFNDIEALACCINPKPQWVYQKDFVGDSTGSSTLEIYGMAVKVENGTMTVAIKANMGPSTAEAFYHSSAADHYISFSDMVFDFGGKKYAVKFAETSNSGVTQRGLYENVTLKDVTAENYGWSSFSSYNRGSLGALPIHNDYFSWTASRSIPMSIKTGTRVAGDNFTMLTSAQLAATGLNFAGNGISEGAKTFGFSFTMPAGMKGDFIAYFFTECINDGMAIMATTPAEMCAEAEIVETCPTTTSTPSVTVSMPTNNPPESAYSITLVNHTGNSWTYQVNWVKGKDLSHWDLALGNCLSHVTSISGGGTKETAGDRSEANPAPGADTTVKTSPLIKWDTQGGTFTITLDDNYAATNIPVLAKTAKVYGTGLVAGPDCSKTCK